jgi:hypothetical protein
MKKYYLTTITLLILLISLKSQTTGELSVSFTTSSAGGNYSPKNIVAVWIEDDSGNFIKTLLAYAQSRKTHLNTWQASTSAVGSEFNTVDAITGPTKTTHSSRTCYWDAADVNGITVPDGTYKIWMELTDKNSTGNFSSFDITKAGNPQSLAPINVPSFGSIIIDWTPTPTNISESSINGRVLIFPNPVIRRINIVCDQIELVELKNIEGTVVYTGISSTIDVSELEKGIYFIKVVNSKNTIVEKLIKL